MPSRRQIPEMKTLLLKSNKKSCPAIGNAVRRRNANEHDALFCVFTDAHNDTIAGRKRSD